MKFNKITIAYLFFSMMIFGILIQNSESVIEVAMSFGLGAIFSWLFILISREIK